MSAVIKYAHDYFQRKFFPLLTIQIYHHNSMEKCSKIRKSIAIERKYIMGNIGVETFRVPEFAEHIRDFITNG